MIIETVADLKKALESGPYAWPGGYPLYFIASDGEALSFAAVEENLELVESSVAENLNDGWRVLGVNVNWEDDSLFCAHTGNRIESAYAEPDDSDGPDLSNAVLFADSARGVFIPQHFAESVKRDCVSGVSKDDWQILETGPEHEHYWGVWSDCEQNATVKDPDNGTQYRLFQDGDLWLVPIA
jgi:hypothetical protein